MILNKEQLPIFYDEIERMGHECDREEGGITLTLPNDLTEYWRVTEMENIPDRYEVKWSGTPISTNDDCAEYITSPQGSHIVEAAWKKATQG